MRLKNIDMVSEKLYRNTYKDLELFCSKRLCLNVTKTAVYITFILTNDQLFKIPTRKKRELRNHLKYKLETMFLSFYFR